MAQLDSDKTELDANFVTFDRRAVHNAAESLRQGHPIYKDVDYIKIVSPGGLNIIETPVRSDHKARYPRLWANCQAAMDGKEQMIGTPLAQWPAVTKAQGETLRGLSFFTVEQIAAASDAQVQAIQMVAPDLRGRAQQWLKQSNARQALEEAEKQKVKDDAEKQELRDRLAKLEAMLQEKVVVKETQVLPNQVISPVTGKPERKYTRKVAA